ncbi:MAG: alpha-L-fucosidase [Candidatus Hydrogenedentes bacterium]|nr:alpha-L-fucosidase [Candidatus Hydrogenedentota bacterium]
MYGYKIFRLSLVVLLCASMGRAVAGEQVPGPDPDSLARWQAWRFGMFIHWGPVSLEGTEIGWSRGREVPREEYDQLHTQFNPAQFDAREWVRIAQDAGMRYMVITSKHHDGFCIWDSALTDYDIMSTPFQRDILKELSGACREAGMPFGTYHSILDWHQPDYNVESAPGKGPGYSLPEGVAPSMDRYQAYLEGQLREIVTNYGPLHSMWFDGEWEKPWTAERGWQLLRFCRELDPKMLVNNRVGGGRHGMQGTTKEGFAPGDYDTPEQQVGTMNTERPWETCMTICRQWAWKPDDDLKSLDECIRILVQTAGGDGNLLLNVGPMPDGRIEPRQVDLLRRIGAWLDVNGESIYETRGGPFVPGKWGVSTHKGSKVYVHVLEWDGEQVQLDGLTETITSAALMDGAAVAFDQSPEKIVLTLEKSRHDAADTIVVLTLDGTAE